MVSFALRMLIGGITKNPDGIGNLQGIYSAFDAAGEHTPAPMLYGMMLKAAEPMFEVGKLKSYAECHLLGQGGFA